jgi:hypothetical protein
MPLLCRLEELLIKLRSRAFELDKVFHTILKCVV